jgi:3'-phosphoadenosine 5'-phosphosulfate (PAPS) 3'-phosphatase
MVSILEKIAREAGNIILKQYQKYKIDVVQKSDGSPVTKADLDAHTFIVHELKKTLIFLYTHRRIPLTILTEKNGVPFG